MKCISNAISKILGRPQPKPHTVTPFHGLDGAWRWHERGANGEITCTSEAFDSKSNAERAARDHCAAKRVYVDA